MASTPDPNAAPGTTTPTAASTAPPTSTTTAAGSVTNTPTPPAAADPTDPTDPAVTSPAVDTSADSATVATDTASAELPRDLTPFGMFMSADIIVKAVMIGLAFASLVTWTIFIAKSIELAGAQRKLKSALWKIEDARSLAEARSEERRVGKEC